MQVAAPTLLVAGFLSVVLSLLLLLQINCATNNLHHCTTIRHNDAPLHHNQTQSDTMMHHCTTIRHNDAHLLLLLS